MLHVLLPALGAAPRALRPDTLDRAIPHQTADGRRFYFVTADTRRPAHVRKSREVQQFNIALQNENFRGATLWKIWRMWWWLPKAADADVVVFTDGEAVFGGCRLDSFAAAYDMAVNATGAPIVASAEAQCYAPGPPALRQWRCHRHEVCPRDVETAYVRSWLVFDAVVRDE